MWELDCEESWAPKNWCFWTVVLEKTFESPLDCKEIQPVHPKGDQSWVFIGRTDPETDSNTLATSCKELTHWRRPWCWEGLGAGGEGDDRGWDGWMASPTWWIWVWVNSGSWWWTGRPGLLRFMGSQRVRHSWATELNWGKKRSLPSRDVLARAEKAISEANTIAKAVAKVGRVMIHQTVSCSTEGNSTLKHRWQIECALLFNSFWSVQLFLFLMRFRILQN